MATLTPASTCKGRNFLKELDFTPGRDPLPARPRGRAQGRQARRHRGGAPPQEGDLPDLREDLDAHPLLVRGRRVRPGRPRHVPGPGRPRRWATRRRSRTRPGCSGGCTTGSSTAASTRRSSRRSPTYAGVPVYNGLTDEFHPTQILADVLTMREHCRQAARARSPSPSSATRANNMGNSLLIGRGEAGHGRAARRRRSAGWPHEELVDEAREIAAADRRPDHAHRLRRGRASRAPTSCTPTSGSRWASPRRSGGSASAELPALPGQRRDDGRDRQPGHEVHALPARPSTTPTPRSARRCSRSIRHLRDGGDRGGVRVAGLDRVRPGREPDAHDQGGPRRHDRATEARRCGSSSRSAATRCSSAASR